MTGTKLNPDQIRTQATRHETTADNIVQQLERLRGEVSSTLALSESAATRALNTTTDRWIDSVKNSVLQHLRSMAENIRRESAGQEAMDEESMQTILNVPMETGNFLGVPTSN